MPEKPRETILIVEDKSLILRAVADKLRTEGLFVLEAKNDVEGLDLAFAKHPNLIILDFHLSGKDYTNMLFRLRADHWGRTVQIITLTNYNVNDQTMLELITGQSSGCLMKANAPIEDILKKIHNVLEIEKKCQQ